MVLTSDTPLFVIDTTLGRQLAAIADTSAEAVLLELLVVSELVVVDRVGVEAAASLCACSNCVLWSVITACSSYK